MRNGRNDEMGFNVGDDRYPDMPAEIVDIGVDYREYEDRGQHRLIVVLKPMEEDSPLSVQTVILNTSEVLDVGGRESVITVGTSESAFELNVHDTIKGGTIKGKARTWLSKLTKLGVKIPNETGYLPELLGLQAEWRQMTYSEAIGRKANVDYEEKRFWVPMKILRQPTGTAEKAEQYNQDTITTEGVGEQMENTLIVLVQANDLKKFQQEAIKIEAVRDNADLMENILDTSETGFWAKHKKGETKK
jgi:hypothetical protein